MGAYELLFVIFWRNRFYIFGSLVSVHGPSLTKHINDLINLLKFIQNFFILFQHQLYRYCGNQLTLNPNAGYISTQQFLIDI